MPSSPQMENLLSTLIHDSTKPVGIDSLLMAWSCKSLSCYAFFLCQIMLFVEDSLVPALRDDSSSTFEQRAWCNFRFVTRGE